ncbi:MAG TPA: hypothetical protein VN257_09900, partial [Actinotalea sp.]|nr:hypothetical protein [Actinotalea sp.]
MTTDQRASDGRRTRRVPGRPALVAGAAAVALLAGVLVGVQVRAAEAEDRREELAAEAAREQAADQ